MANTQCEGAFTNLNTTYTFDSNGESRFTCSNVYPPQLLLLPNNISNDARIVTLKDPRGFNDTRYLVCPERGVHELRSITGSGNIRRSLFLYPNHNLGTRENETNELRICSNHTGYIMRNASLLVATLIDPLFLILPSLVPSNNTKSSERQKSLYLSFEDYLDRLNTDSSHLMYLSGMTSIKKQILHRMIVVCDSVGVDDEKMYRLNEDKLVKELTKKALRMAKSGLPLSMEEKFIKKTLEVPLTNVKFEEECPNESVLAEEKNDSEIGATNIEKSSKIDAFPYATIPDISSKHKSNINPKNGLLFAEEYPVHKLVNEKKVSDLLRIKTSLQFIISNYIAPQISERLKDLLFTQNALIDFTPLDNHLTNVGKLRQDAVNSRLNDDYSRKRPRLEDEELETRAEKRNKEEKMKKTSSCSRGVIALKKANISGMKKMSEFFKKS
ncbi:putative ribonuclease h2 subunit b protein [Erysiphe neolycopersici]|uniref:Ribonuclease H2 subunit B n=1 Tax=Erysiphe neolycopersici TaxID=212602 RepID=A0A420HXK6_9PEZI|nr:putative ribonuclease h2 subunit b protein [Erysiphe neolycopersici]